MRSLLLLSLLFPFLLHGQRVIQNKVYFSSGSYELGKATLRALDSLSPVIIETPPAEIRVSGFTDSAGTAASNQALSDKRAGAVRDYLVAKGVKSKISCAGHGEDVSGTGMEYNRRVEIVLSFPDVKQETPDIFEEILPEKPEPTIVKGNKGTIVKIPPGAFGAVSNSDVTLEVKEFFDMGPCVFCGITTQTEDGQCLETGGMVFLEARNGNTRIDSVTGNTMIEVWVPAESYDAGMGLYRSVRMPDGTIAWKPLETELKMMEDGKKYYVFETRAITGYNIDKPPAPESTICAVSDSAFLNTGRFVNGKNYVIYSQPRSAYSFSRVSPNISTMNNLSPKDAPVVVSIAVRNGHRYMASVPLGKLKVKKKNGKKMYKIKKKQYKPLGDNMPDCPDF